MTQTLVYIQHFGTFMLHPMTLSSNTSEFNSSQTAHKFYKYHVHILHSSDMNRLQSKTLYSWYIKKKQLKLFGTLKCLVLHSLHACIPVFTLQYCYWYECKLCMRTRHKSCFVYAVETWQLSYCGKKKHTRVQLGNSYIFVLNNMT